MGHVVTVQIYEQFSGLVEHSWVLRVGQQVLSLASPRETFALDMLVADDHLLRSLNREFCGLDEVTDVLAFPLFEAGSQPTLAGDVFPSMPGGEHMLGEVIVSCSQALKQAEDRDIPLAWEIAHLFTHGVLHLLGYDHVNNDGEEMGNIENEFLYRIVGVSGIHSLGR